MGTLLVILFVVSLPIFWLYGLIVFIRNLFGNKIQEKNNDLLASIVTDLELLKSRRVTVKEIYEKYKKSLDLEKPFNPAITSQIPQSPEPEEPDSTNPILTGETIRQPIETGNILTQDMNVWWERWYEDNNINLLLYIGAFLIVSSAAIFVGFNWEQVAGAAKAFILTAISLAFFISGFFFYSQTPKLKNAGSTFLAIGSLLIPFNGLAWYNFYLNEIGFSFGLVWLVTSLLAISVYFFLAFFLRHPFYTYIAGLGSLSLVEALVNIGDLNVKFYILGGIFSSFTLLAGSRFFTSVKKEEFDRIYAQPLSVSSNIIMPIFLTWGLASAYFTGQLFSPEVYLSSLLASGYYSVSYLASRNVSIFTLALLLLSLSFVLLTKTHGVNGTPVFLLIFLNSFVYLFFAYYLNQKKFNQEGFYASFVAIFISGLALSIALVDPLISINFRIYFSLIVAFLGLIASLVQKNYNYLYITTAGVDLGAFIYVAFSLQQPELFPYLGVFYILLGCTTNLLANISYGKNSKANEVLFNISALNLIFSAGLTFTEPSVLLIVGLLVMGTAFINYYKAGKTDQIFSIPGSILLSLLSLALLLPRSEITYLNKIYFSLVVATTGLLASYRENKPFYLFITIGGLDLAAYLYFNNTFIYEQIYKYLGVFYLIFGSGLYLLGQFTWKKARELSQILLISSAFNLVLALLLTIWFPGYSLIVSLTFIVITIAASYYLEKSELFYLTVCFSVLGVFNILRFYNTPLDYYPLAFSTLGVIWYLTGLVPSRPNYQKQASDSSLVILTSTPVLFGLSSYENSYSSSTLLEFNSLASAYLTSGFLIFDAFRRRNSSVAYFASVASLLTILWQYNYLGISEMQVYLVTIGIYFLGLAYIKRGQNKKEDQQLFDTLGLLILIIPLTLQALPSTGAWYALLLGIEGVLLLLAGFSLNYKTYIYAGSAAIGLATLTRVYSFVSSLPSWAVIGLGGLFILGIAIFLLNKRKLDEP